MSLQQCINRDSASRLNSVHFAYVIASILPSISLAVRRRVVEPHLHAEDIARQSPDPLFWMMRPTRLGEAAEPELQNPQAPPWMRQVA